MKTLLSTWILISSVLGSLGVAQTDPATLRIEVQTAAGAAITVAQVAVNGVPLEGDGTGTFMLEGSGALVSIHAPAYLSAEHAWEGAPGRLVVTLVPVPVLAVRLTGDATQNQWDSFIDLADSTAINAFVIDFKDDSGRVLSLTPSGIADEVNASTPLFDLADRVDAAHDAGVYVIARIVAFQDATAARAEPSWAVWDTSTNSPYNKSGQWFLDPWDADARRYSRTLAEDACALGVDEVQFDYVRFPDGYPSSARFDGPVDEAGRSEAISSFLAEVRDELAPEGCAVAADIFGFITSTPGDGGIGQQLEDLAQVTDVLSPMLYPSHYSTGWFGFSNPNSHPYDVIYQAVEDGQVRMDGYPSVLRPWLQDFYYTDAQVAAEIAAADDQGVGWILWNALSSYSVGALPGEGHLAVEDAKSFSQFSALPASGFFDVPEGYLFENEIVWLAQEGITFGCNPPYNDLFCPSIVVTREQMAAFLGRAFHYSATEGDRFSDDDDSVFEADIDRLAAMGVTAGCNPPVNDHFCPKEEVSRGQMAAFLKRALALPAATEDFFVDDQGSVFEADINAMASAGLAFGNGAGEFLPSQPISRDQMAAFLYRALASE